LNFIKGKNMSTFDTTSHQIPFTVRLVKNGESYGLNDSLTHDKDDPLVEFYDARYKHTEHGQFVSRYYATTLMENHGTQTRGINLDGGVPAWYLDPKAMTQVIDWLKEQPEVIQAVKDAAKNEDTIELGGKKLKF
jgi:hypothetical protein